MPPIVRALRHRDYRLYFSGQFVSLIGTWMQHVAMSWLAYRLSGSAWVLGLVAFAGQIPALVLAPIGGAIADRLDRRRVLIATQIVAAGQALVLTVITALHLVVPAQLIVLALLLGCVNAMEIPARQSYFVHLVADRDDLSNAIALNSFALNSARLVGPGLGGMVVGWAGETVCFGINAASYATVLLALLALRVRTARRRDGAVLADIADGFRYAFGHAAVRTMLLVVAATSFAATPYTTLMPLFARDIFGGDARTLGLMMACSGAGAIAGTIYLAWRSEVRGIERSIGRALLIAALGVAVYSRSEALWLALPALFATGLGVITAIAGSNTLIQSLVRDELRGRVMALFTMAFLGIAPLGSLVGGALAERIGAPYTLAISALVVLGVALAFRRVTPRLFSA